MHDIGHDAGSFEHVRTGLARAVEREILEHLEQLATDGTEAAIDLRGLPMSTADREELETRLGRGEVRATLRAMGESEVWETRFNGVWWVRHRGTDGRVVSEQVEITPVPEILKADPADSAMAAARLREQLADAAEQGLSGRN